MKAAITPADFGKGHNEVVYWFFENGYDSRTEFSNMTAPYLNDSTLEFVYDYLTIEKNYSSKDARQVNQNSLADTAFIAFVNSYIDSTLTRATYINYMHDVASSEGASSELDGYFLEAYQYKTSSPSNYLNHLRNYDRTNFNIVDNRLYDLHLAVTEASINIFRINNDGNGPVPLYFLPPGVLDQLDASAALANLVQYNNPDQADAVGGLCSAIFAMFP